MYVTDKKQIFDYNDSSRGFSDEVRGCPLSTKLESRRKYYVGDTQEGVWVQTTGEYK
jgi:hypothetical protein